MSHFGAVMLRLTGLVLGFFGIFLCCVGIGFAMIALARDLFETADEMECGS